MSTLRVDPCILGNVAAVEEFVNIGDGHLSVARAGDDEHRCGVHAARCAEMAVAARTPRLKATFLELSKNWEKLAVQLENAFAQLAENEAVRSNAQESINQSRALRKK